MTCKIANIPEPYKEEILFTFNLYDLLVILYENPEYENVIVKVIYDKHPLNRKLILILKNILQNEFCVDDAHFLQTFPKHSLDLYWQDFQANFKHFEKFVAHLTQSEKINTDLVTKLFKNLPIISP
jgi:Tol biopolymer transport system component